MFFIQLTDYTLHTKTWLMWDLVAEKDRTQRLVKNVHTHTTIFRIEIVARPTRPVFHFVGL